MVRAGLYLANQQMPAHDACALSGVSPGKCSRDCARADRTAHHREELRSETARSKKGAAVTHKRWLVAVSILAAAAVAYIDRSNLPVAGPVLVKDARANGLAIIASLLAAALWDPPAGNAAQRAALTP